MQASAQGNALSRPVLREEAEPAVLPAQARLGRGCAGLCLRQGVGEGSHSRQCWVLGVRRSGSNPDMTQAMGSPWGGSSQRAGTPL